MCNIRKSCSGVQAHIIYWCHYGNGDGGRLLNDILNWVVRDLPLNLQPAQSSTRSEYRRLLIHAFFLWIQVHVFIFLHCSCYYRLRPLFHLSLPIASFVREMWLLFCKVPSCCATCGCGHCSPSAWLCLALWAFGLCEFLIPCYVNIFLLLQFS